MSLKDICAPLRGWGSSRISLLTLNHNCLYKLRITENFWCTPHNRVLRKCSLDPALRPWLVASQFPFPSSQLSLHPQPLSHTLGHYPPTLIAPGPDTKLQGSAPTPQSLPKLLFKLSHFKPACPASLSFRAYMSGPIWHPVFLTGNCEYSKTVKLWFLSLDLHLASPHLTSGNGIKTPGSVRKSCVQIYSFNLHHQPMKKLFTIIIYLLLLFSLYTIQKWRGGDLPEVT